MLEKLKNIFSKKEKNKNLKTETKFLREHVEISLMAHMKFEYLSESDRVTWNKESQKIYVEYEDIYYLSQEELEYFNLPPLFPGKMNIEPIGNFLNITHGVKFRIRFFDNAGEEYFSKFQNNYVTSMNKNYFLNEDHYKLYLYIHNYNSDETKFRSEDEQYRALGEIRKIALNANVIFSDELKKLPQLEILDRLEIDFQETDENKLKIIPKLIGIMDESTEKKFQKIFSENGNVKKYYQIEIEGVKKNIVLTKELREVLQVLKEERETITQENLLNQKGKIFNDARMENENIEIIYGPRVKGLGFVTYRPSFLDSSSGIDWFEKDYPYIFTTEEKIKLYPEHIKYFEEKLKTGKENLEIEIFDDGEKKRFFIEKENLGHELEKIKKSTYDYIDFSKKKDLENIIKLSKETSEDYVEYDGFYVFIDKDISTMENYLKDLIEEIIPEKGDIEKTSKGGEALLLKDNEEEIDYTEEKKDSFKLLPFERPNSLKENTVLYKFQEEAVAQFQSIYAENSINGVLISDDMGLGKTLQILTFLAWIKEKESISPSLLVVPSSLIYNWYNEDENEKKQGEIQRYFLKNTFKVKIIKGKINKNEFDEIKNFDLILMTYETLRINHIETGKIEWKVIICDEAQKIKNPSALVTTAIKTQNAKFKIACSATPIENSLVDLWCITDFVKPSLLGSLKEFKNKYISGNKEVKTPEELKQLNEEIKGNLGRFYIRRTKEVLNSETTFPKKILKYEPIKMTQKQVKVIKGYYDMKNQGFPIIGLIQNMIMACSHPRLVEKNDVDNIAINTLLEEAEKLERVKLILDSIKEKSEKAIIFTKYKDMHIILSNFIKNFYGFYPIVISGEVENKRRKELLDEYRGTSGFNIILLSPEAAGVGLNIVEANHVIHYTRLWNPAKEDQATDRAYRIGQKKDVYVYYPIVCEEIYDKKRQEFLSYKDMNNYFLNKENFTSPEENLNKIILRKKMMLEEFFLAIPPEENIKDFDNFFN